MKKNILKILVLFSWFLPAVCLAADPLLNSSLTGDMGNLASNVAGIGGYSTGGTTTIGSIIASLASGFLAMLGIIFLILIILAGWKYMMARGDEAKTTEALDQIRHAVIGLLIIIAAYAITYFVFTYLPFNGGGNGGTTIR